MNIVQLNLFRYKRKIQELLDDDDERGGGNAKMARYDVGVANALD